MQGTLPKENHGPTGVNHLLEKKKKGDNERNVLDARAKAVRNPGRKRRGGNRWGKGKVIGQPKGT